MEMGSDLIGARAQCRKKGNDLTRIRLNNGIGIKLDKAGKVNDSETRLHKKTEESSS